MGKDQERELQRLEQALMADMVWEEEPEADPLEWVEESYRQSPVHCEVSNTDRTDVDLETFSQEVYQGHNSSFLPGLITVLALTLLVVMVLWLLRYLGVIG